MDQEPILSQPKPVIPPSTPPAKKFNPLLTLAVVVLLIMFGAGGLILGKSLYGPKTPALPTSSVLPTPTPDLTVYTEDSRSANWKTYSNKELDFLIKYPSEWIIDSDTEAKSLNIIRFYQSITDETNNPKLIPKMNLYVIENKNISLENFEKNLKKPTKFSVNGITGLKGYEKSSYYGTEKESNYTAYIISDNLTYTLTMGMDTNDNLINIFDQILSTFKFLDQNQGKLSTTRTYTNETFGYSINIPEGWAVYFYQKQPSDYIGPKESIMQIKKDLETSGYLGDGGCFGPLKIEKTDRSEPYKPDWVKTDQKEIMIDNKPTQLFENTALTYGPGFEVGYKWFNVIVENEESKLFINLCDEKYKDHFDQILSTFKFD